MTLNSAHRSVLSDVEKSLLSSDYLLLRLDGSKITDRQTLYEQCIRQIPMGDATLDPEIDWGIPRNWDAFEDFFIQGIADSGSVKCALLWLSSDTLLGSDLQTFLEFLDALIHVKVKMNESSAYRGESSIEFLAVLEGSCRQYDKSLEWLKAVLM